MRSYAALLASVLLLSGCSGMDKFFDDTITLPGENPEAPQGNSENMERVQGHVVSSAPILPQGENIWPSRPPALPTLSDVANDDKGFSLSDYSRAAGADPDAVTHGEEHDKAAIPADFPEDGNLSIGEQVQIKQGITDFLNGRLPDSIKDKGTQYIEKNNTTPIIVPNGDGSSTVIDAKGVVRIVPDSHLKSEPKAGKPQSGAE